MRPIIGITMGDVAGIGAEIIVKSLMNKEIYDTCIPIVIGDAVAMEDAICFTGSTLKMNYIRQPEEAKGSFGEIDCINLGYFKPEDLVYKKVYRLSGEASFQYVIRAIDLAKGNRLHAVVTGPINKEAINLAGHHFSGHTEIFAHYTNTEKYGMLLTSKKLRVIHVTTHVSMRDACNIIREQPERVYNAIHLAQEAMRLLGVQQPRIGVAGLNAHCSENGLFGDEEEKSIIPAIEKCRAEGMTVDGPVPPDTAFVKAIGGQYDIVVAMYHDQGHIPLKLSGFQMDISTGRYSSMSGVNATIGLPVIRTSVDHGTAYGKAGEGRANEESMIDSIMMAVKMANVCFTADKM